MDGDDRYDWIVVGSGFGGSVSALRLAEKGHRVLVLEKGLRWKADDFPRTNWNLRRWLWLPALGLRGFFQMSFMRHVTILHGVGVGGGSLVYANTLPTPKDDFFEAPSWSGLADWKSELAPHYATAARMLGATECATRALGDRLLEDVAEDLGRRHDYEPTRVGVFFGEADVEVPDPYFGGDGPPRRGCTSCGACMTGCRVGAKNTLDRNYLFLAERLGVEVRAEREVVALRRHQDGGYALTVRPTFGSRRQTETVRGGRVVLAGGVMGTVPLLLSMASDPQGLPDLSPRVGDFVRTNNESVLAVVAGDPAVDVTEGVAIGSILHTDEHSHLEPVHYGKGSGFYRLLTLPYSPGRTMLGRLLGALGVLIRHPLRFLRTLLVRDWGRQAQILLYMRTLDETLSVRLGRSLRTLFRRGLVTHAPRPEQAPKAFLPEATALADRFASKLDGLPTTLVTETLLGVPTTAHILGGCCMGATPEEGVIDAGHRVHGYDGLYVIDGSAVSANPGVNPSLTITALAERAMAAIPPKGQG